MLSSAVRSLWYRNKYTDVSLPVFFDHIVCFHAWTWYFGTTRKLFSKIYKKLFSHIFSAHFEYEMLENYNPFQKQMRTVSFFKNIVISYCSGWLNVYIIRELPFVRVESRKLRALDCSHQIQKSYMIQYHLWLTDKVMKNTTAMLMDSFALMFHGWMPRKMFYSLSFCLARIWAGNGLL